MLSSSILTNTNLHKERQQETTTKSTKTATTTKSKDMKLVTSKFDITQLSVSLKNIIVFLDNEKKCVF